jgi:hypothetical protein
MKCSRSYKKKISMKYSIKDIRKLLLEYENELRKVHGKNKLSEKYRVKVTYMIMWLRLLPCKKGFLNKWKMPDYSTIIEIEKESSL